MIFAIEITDRSKILGIGAARAALNAALSVPSGEVLEKQPGYMGTDLDYLAHVVNIAARSYADTFGTNITDLEEQQKALADQIAKLKKETA